MHHALVISTCLLLLATTTPVTASPPDCDMPQDPNEILYCTTRNIDGPDVPTTHASVSVISAGCYIEQVRAHASGKGFHYTWMLTAGSESESDSGAGLPSPMISDGPFELSEGQSVSASASIWNTALAFDQAEDSNTWTCRDGDLVQEIRVIVQDVVDSLT